MTPEQAAALRAPFPATAIGKLPKPTKKDNAKGKCDECGGWHGLPAVHLDYVGHAAATDRLLQVDPEWTWKPMAQGPNGEPLLTNGGLWIELTVCGVTRPGFGDEGNGKGTKEIIGDAIRNAAMRFGVALDLWAKEDLNASEGEPQATAGLPTTPAPPVSQAAQNEPASPSEDYNPFQPPETSGVTLPPDNGLPQDVTVHFGKNAGRRLGELSPKSQQWYAENELRADASPADRRLKAAAQTLVELDSAA